MREEEIGEDEINQNIKSNNFNKEEEKYEYINRQEEELKEAKEKEERRKKEATRNGK